MDKQYLDKSKETADEAQVVQQVKDVINSDQQQKMRKAKYLAKL